VPPHFEIVSTKGLDDDQTDNLKKEIEMVMKEHYHDEAEEQVLYNLFENLTELIGKYNDSVEGRCYICLDELCSDKNAKFLE
jgi:hypothetical protein